MSINHPDLRNIVLRQQVAMRGPNSSLMPPEERIYESALDAEITDELVKNETKTEKIKTALGKLGMHTTYKQSER